MLVIQYFLDLFAAWRNEDLTKMDFIRGYSELLLEGGSGALTDEQRQAIETMHHLCMRTIEDWHHRGAYIRLLDDQPISLETIIKQTLYYLHGWLLVDKDSIHVSLSENLPPVAGKLMSTLPIVIASIIADVRQDNPLVTIKANSNEDGTILVQIQIQFNDKQYETRLKSALSRTDTDLYIADLIMQRCGSAIKLILYSEWIEFQFVLPPLSSAATSPNQSQPLAAGG